MVYGFNMKTHLQNVISPKELGMSLTCFQFLVIIEKLVKTKYPSLKSMMFLRQTRQQQQNEKNETLVPKDNTFQN